MFGIIIVIHSIICSLLIVIILVQRGRGGGLVESFSGLDSMFGTKTNTFLARATTVLATMFLFTCLTLAVISARQGKSLMQRIKPSQAQPPQRQEADSSAVVQEAESQAQSASEGKPQTEPLLQQEAQSQPAIPSQQEVDKAE